MKKGYELLGKLSKENQEKFCRSIINHRPVKTKISDYLIKDYADFDSFISQAFTWRNTPEGHQYWFGIANETIKS